MTTDDTSPGGKTLLPWLVAHRGWPARYPENSLAGMQAVMEAGAHHVECDLQLTADRQVVVLHDDHLDRLLGLPGRVGDLELAELRAARLRLPDGEGFSDQSPPDLPTLLDVVAQYPSVTLFLELKRASMRRYGRDALLAPVLSALADCPNPVVLISFDAQVLERARARGAPRIGWVFKPWDEAARAEAARLGPEYLFVRQDRVPPEPEPFWSGPWQWVVYGPEKAEVARALLSRGADLIETDYLPEMVGQDDG